jgi:hypothetical protein
LTRSPTEAACCLPTIGRGRDEWRYFFHVGDGSSTFKDEMGQNFSSLDAAMTSAVAVASALSQLAEQDQDQEDNDHESEPAAPVVAGPIERTAPDPAEAT